MVTSLPRGCGLHGGKCIMGGAFTGMRCFFSGSFYDKIFMILNPYGTVGPEHG